MNNTLQILSRDKLPLGGFAGLKEHRLVTDKKAWGHHANPYAWQGLGNFVYLADATFMPKGETRMHRHSEIDVISFMLNGRIAHEGSLEHGEILTDYDIQVQRAGGEGFKHNEVNPDNAWNRMLQLWVLPENPGEPASYKKYKPELGKVTRIYGGDKTQTETFVSQTEIRVALLKAEQEISLEGEFKAYLALGSGRVNDKQLKEGDLFSDNNLHFIANEHSYVIIVTMSK